MAKYARMIDHQHERARTQELTQLKNVRGVHTRAFSELAPTICPGTLHTPSIAPGHASAHLSHGDLDHGTMWLSKRRQG